MSAVIHHAAREARRHQGAHPRLPRRRGFARERRGPRVQGRDGRGKGEDGFIIYEGAQHGFTKPGPAYQEKADKESWAAMKKFFAQILR